MKTSLVAVLLSILLLQACATAAEDAATPVAPTAEDVVAEASTPMQQHMQQMQTQMAAIKAEQDPEKRAALMMQHMETMKEGMAMMDHAAAKDTANLTMAERMEKMEQRMGMMQMMMGRMMQPHEGEATPEGASAEHEHAE